MRDMNLSLLTWNVISKNHVKNLFNEFLRENTLLESNTVISEYELIKGFSTLSLELISSRRIFLNTEGQYSFWESNAKLIYSMSVNGSIAVILYPHSSELSRSKLDCYVIDHIEHSDQIPTQIGRAKIRRHLESLKSLSDITQLQRLPQKSDLKIIKKLLGKNKKYSSIYADYNDERKVDQQANIALGTGLAGGLIASSIIPMLINYGDQARLFYKQENHEACEYFCRGAANYLTTENMLLLTIIVLGLVVYKTRSTILE